MRIGSRSTSKRSATARAVYPSPQIVRPDAPLILVEGEFDALLLGQELGESAVVVTLGSASARPSPELLWTLSDARPIFAAHDADPAGDRAAGDWSARAIRARPPEPNKDWTDVHRRGGSRIRVVWSGFLTPTLGAGLPTPLTELGAGLTELGAGLTTPPEDDYDRQERAAITEFDGGSARETARAAGI